MPLLWFLACNGGHPCAPDELLLADGTCHDPQDDTSDTAADTAPVEPFALPYDCSAPATGADPLVELGYSFHGQDVPGPDPFAEIVDLERVGDRLYAVGQGGLLTFDVSDPADIVFHGFHPERHGRFHRVEPLDGDLLAVAHRDNIVVIIDATDPESLVELAQFDVAGVEGLLWHEGKLFATQRSGGVLIYEDADGGWGQTGGFGALDAPWEISKPTAQGYAYVADAVLGVVPVDLAGERLGEPFQMDESILHVAVSGDHVYVASGGGGVVILDASSPEALVEVGRAQTSGSAVQVWVAEDRLWVSDHSGLAVFDVSDPADPQPLGREITEQFALGMYAQGDLGYVGDWNYLRIYQVDPAAGSPDADWSADDLFLDSAGGERTLTVRNLGSGTLDLAGATWSDDRLSMLTDADALAPGEVATLTLSFSGGEDLDATLCIATNDPDGPLTEIPLRSGQGDPPVGQVAPDFTVQDLDGDTHTLSEQLGHPVLLAYFATW